MVTLSLATLEDLDAVWALMGRTVAHMRASGNPQWGEDYPTRPLYTEDVALGELYKAEEDGVLLGAGIITARPEEAYEPVSWMGGEPSVALHRLAVEPTVRRRGVGAAFFERARQTALALGARSLRIDTYSLNRPMQAVILSRGYEKRGEIYFPYRPLPFYCYEKVLD
ncbi:MAG: GNAT family N-acetyltransferase [Clostridiales bacterium]|nr:GNAT family N-acetyltransferase [Clostridiales bacterium]